MVEFQNLTKYIGWLTWLDHIIMKKIAGFEIQVWMKWKSLIQF